MRVAVDAMGGDKGPEEVARGVIEAARDSETHFLLVGNPKVLEAELGRAKPRPGNVEIVPASEVIDMHDQPATAIKRKPDASIVVAARLVKDKKADALVSIANTGAVMAVSLLTLGRIKGINRPAIAALLPSHTGVVALLDAGATVDCDPNNLFEFATMGAVYAEAILGIPAPRVGLLSNGEEASKGNDLVKRTHVLFSQIEVEQEIFRFVGNVEGRDVFRGHADVIVCDGFVGNVFLKTGEGAAEFVMKLIKEELGRPWMRPFLVPVMPALRRLAKRLDYSDYGGAPLLGINGVCIIGHGRSNARAIVNACRVAERAIQNDIVKTIRQRICDTPTPPL